MLLNDSPTPRSPKCCPVRCRGADGPRRPQSGLQFQEALVGMKFLENKQEAEDVVDRNLKDMKVPTLCLVPIRY